MEPITTNTLNLLLPGRTTIRAPMLSAPGYSPGAPAPRNCTAASHMRSMPKFDYSAPAEIFGTGGFSRQRKAVAYRRFPSGAEAVRFAVEDVPAALQRGIVLNPTTVRPPRHPRYFRRGAIPAVPACRSGLAAARVTFRRPFALRGLEGVQPAGTPAGRDRRGAPGAALLPRLAPHRHNDTLAPPRLRRVISEGRRRPTELQAAQSRDVPRTWNGRNLFALRRNYLQQLVLERSRAVGCHRRPDEIHLGRARSPHREAGHNDLHATDFQAWGRRA